MLLWSTFAWATVVAGQSTTDIRFIGWYIKPDSTIRFTAGAGWSTSGTVAGDCVPPNTCVLHTTCISNTLFFADGGSSACTDTSICAAWTIFETLPFGSPSATNWECRTPQLASKNTLYRNLPAAPTIEKTVYATVTRMATTNPPDTPLPTSSPSPSPSLSPSPLAAADDAANKGWIAAAVVGPIAGLGLCAVAYRLWTRHRSHNDQRIGTEHKAHSPTFDEQQVWPQPEVFRQQVASPFMLHADSGRKTPELAG